MAPRSRALVRIHDPLDRIRATMVLMGARPGQPPLGGIAAGLTVRDPAGWTPATALTDGTAVDDLLAGAARRWRADPPAAAALAFRCYSYWVAVPAVIGYAAGRRVPLMRPESVLLRWHAESPFLTIGLHDVEVVGLDDDPMAVEGRLGSVPDEAALIDAMRLALVDEHLTAVVEQLRRRVHLGRRTLWGSFASGLATGVSRAAAVLPVDALSVANRLLTGLQLPAGHPRLAELVDLSATDDGLHVQRHTCCLAFTLETPRVCSGCCIR